MNEYGSNCHSQVASSGFRSLTFFVNLRVLRGLGISKASTTKGTKVHKGNKTGLIAVNTHTLFIAGSQMNLWICNPKRAGTLSASIHSANSRGSSKQCEL